MKILNQFLSKKIASSKVIFSSIYGLLSKTGADHFPESTVIVESGYKERKALIEGVTISRSPIAWVFTINIFMVSIDSNHRTEYNPFLEIEYYI